MSHPGLRQTFVTGTVKTPIGLVPRVSSSLTRDDRIGGYKVRWGIGRMHYTVDPGLYALGQPDSTSAVLVSANYKMSFDRLREALPGRNAWILVLDTKGINVWCAAGKGTFGTSELAFRVQSSRLDQVVSHRQLILPQLGAPGVAAHEVKKLSGFRAVYGPVRAVDLPAFLDAGLKATPEMRRKSFTLSERAVLIPVELVPALKAALYLLPVLLLLGGLAGPHGFLGGARAHGFLAIAALSSAIAAGCILTPLLLPWLPGRAFAVKGLGIGLAAAVFVLSFHEPHGSVWSGRMESMAWLLAILSISSYLGMNFTGASTYTSLSGVRREMRWALPIQIGAGATGMVLWLVSLFIVS